MSTPSKVSTIFLLQKLTSPASLALIALFTIAGASADASTRPDLGARFGYRTLELAGGTVGVGAASDAMVVRVSSSLGREAVVSAVEAAVSASGIAGIFSSAPVVADVVRVGDDGLYAIHFSAPLPRSALLEIADRLSKSGGCVQVYPVLARASGRAFYGDELVVTARPGLLDRVLTKVLSRIDGTLVRRSRVPHTALVRVGPAQDADAISAARSLNSGPPVAGLVAAEPRIYRALRPTTVLDDPLLSEQWHLFRSDAAVPGAGEIQVDEAWDTTLGDPEIIIGVFDSGTDVDHADLAPNVVGGFDAVSGDEDPRPECSPLADGRDVAAGCPQDSPYRESHGTSVSGTAAGRGDNGLGGSGVCPRCSLFAVRLLGYEPLGDSITTAEAFIRAADAGVAVMNNSWGPGTSRYFPLAEVEREALRYARYDGRGGLGAVVVFAAGNSSANVAADPYARDVNVFAVAGSTNLDDWAYYSNYGLEIDIAAPTLGGAVPEDEYGIVTTDVTGDDGYDAGDFALEFGGTSASSPIVAGVAGLVLSANPALTADQVRIILASTADKIRADKVDWEEVFATDIAAIFDYDAAGHSIGFGFGRVNAAAAVAAAAEPPLQGALCDAAGCSSCDDEGRCRQRCKLARQCPGGTRCEAGYCTEQHPEPTDVGELCATDCTYCLSGFNSALEPFDYCTGLCGGDEDCPAGFDCRLLGAEGPRLCTLGVPFAGEPVSIYPMMCWDDIAGGAVVVVGGDGQQYCSELCLDDTDGTCPYGFHCAEVRCDCAWEGHGGWCFAYECQETLPAMGNWHAPQCVPDIGYGVSCTESFDCKSGDYCAHDGICRLDDREGCSICTPCEYEGDECGVRGICTDFDDGTGAHCAWPCAGEEKRCPGDSVCREVERRFGTMQVCTAPELGPGGELCPSSYSCTVACRDDIPCPDGEVCEEGACVPAPVTPDAGVGVDSGGDAPPPEDGCGCRSTPHRGLAGLLLAAVGLLFTRRQRRR